MQNRAQSRNLVPLLLPVLIGLILLLTSTTHLIRDLWNYDTKRLLQICFLLILFLTAASNKPLREAVQQQVANISRVNAWLILVIFSIGIFSAAYHAGSLRHLAYSLTEVWLMASLLAGVLVIAAVRVLTGSLFDRLMLCFLVMLGLVVGVQELLGVVAARSAGLEFNFRISLLHFSWPRFFNQVQSWVIPVLAAVPALFWRKPLAKILCILAIGLNDYVLLMTGARGSIVALVSALSIILILFPAVRRETLIWQLGGLLVGMALYVAVLQFITSSPALTDLDKPPESAAALQSAPQTSEPPANQSQTADSSFFQQSLGRKMLNTSGRGAMWLGALNDIKSNPLLGTGPMNFACKGRLNEAGHPHNFGLQVAVEWGIPAALALMALLIRLVLSGWKRLRQDHFDSQEERLLAVLLTTGVIAAAVHAGLSGVLVMPASQLTGVLVGGWLLGVLNHHSQANPGQSLVESSVRKFSISMLVTLSILTAAVLLFSANEIASGDEWREQTRVTDALIPRFWQNGKTCGI